MSNTTRTSYKSIGRGLLADIRSVQARVQRAKNNTNLSNNNKTSILTTLDSISNTIDDTREKFLNEANALLAKGVRTNNISNSNLKKSVTNNISNSNIKKSVTNNISNSNLKNNVSSPFITKKLQMNKTKIPKIMEMDAIMNKISGAQWKAAARIQKNSNRAKNEREKAVAKKRNATFSSINAKVAQLKNRVGNNNRVVSTDDKTLPTLNANMAAKQARQDAARQDAARRKKII